MRVSEHSLLLAAFLAGCEGSSDGDARRGHPGGGDSGVGGPSVALSGDWLSFPYVEVGDALLSASIELQNMGSDDAGAVRVEVQGPFRASAPEGRIAAGASMAIEVTPTFDTAQPSVERGSLVVRVGDESWTVGLSAVVGTRDLPAATWDGDDDGTWAYVELPSAPFPDGHASYRDSTVLIALPPGFGDTGEAGLVTHFHGHNATVEGVVETQYLRTQFALSGREAVFLVPQGPVEAADSDFGKLDEENGFRDLVLDALAVLYRDGLVTRPNLGATVLTSHSGGYNVVANVIVQGGLPIDAVHLFDSLYARESDYEDFVLGGGTFRSVYTAGGGTDDNNQAFAGSLRREGVDISDSFADADLAADIVTIGYSEASHGGCVSEERAFARWLAWSGLPTNPAAPAEVLYAVADGDAARVARRVAVDAPSCVVESRDGAGAWAASEASTSGTAQVTAALELRVRCGDGPATGDPSDRYGATGSDWLVVDGFDRVLDGSFHHPTHAFAAEVGAALGAGFSSASNEAIAEGLVDLSDFDHVIWLLGDEGASDRTFSDPEMVAVEDYVAAGGSIVVSGSEVGYATDGAFLRDTLHAGFVSDDAGTTEVEGWTVGDAYPEDYPDVLSGTDTIWSWSTGGAAAVGWKNRVVVVGFGVENLSEVQREEALGELVDYLR